MGKNNKEKLLKLLSELSYSEGDFTLSSGKKSSYYIDCKLTSLNGEGLYLIAKLFLEKIKQIDFHVDAIGGPTIGADPIIGAVISLAHSDEEFSKLNGFIIRKEPKGYGKKKLIEGPWKQGNKVIIIEDVITTGASAYKAISAIEEAGGEIIYVFSIIDREEGGRAFLEEKGYKFFSLFSLSDLKNYKEI